MIGTRLHALLHGDTVEAAAPREAWWLPAARYYLTVEKNSTKAPEDFAELAGNVSNRITFAYQILWSTPVEDLPTINEVSSCRISATHTWRTLASARRPFWICIRRAS